MFSAFTNAQNKVSIIPITAVTFSIASNTNSTYTGSAQSVTVVSVTPPGATYSTATTTATNAGGVASTTITGTGIYTGSFTSPNLTIVAATITGTAANPSTSYNAGSQSGTVITGVTVGATFSGSVTASGTNAGTYTSSITGTGNYTGTVNGGTFTISQVSLSITTPVIISCGANDVGTMSFTISGFQGGDSGSVTTFTGIGSPTSTAPVSTNDSSAINSVSQSQGANPKTSIGNGTNTIILCVSGNGFEYWVQITGSANYIASGQVGPFIQDCGS